MKLLLLLLLPVPVFSQNFENKEGFDNLPKGTIRKEVACFSTFGEEEKNNSIKRGKTYFLPAGLNSMKVKRENITATIKIKSFIESENKITKNADGQIEKINGKHVFGMDYDEKPPSTVMNTVRIYAPRFLSPPIKDGSIFFPSTAMAPAPMKLPGSSRIKNTCGV
jgi:hypothetical protein